jgi:hypothetical protein
MTINLPCFSIAITLGPEDPEHPGTYQGGTIASDLKRQADSRLGRAAMDAVEALVLAHACAGVDVASPAYAEGLETAVEACWNRFD